MILPYYWNAFSKKMVKRIESPRHAGIFTEEEAHLHQMRFVVGQEGDIKRGIALLLYWLVDEEDGVIADSQFQVKGSPALIAAADAACELLIRKNYDQAARLTADLIDRQMRDHSEQPAFPRECFSDLNRVIAAIEHAVQMCSDISLADGYTAPPMQGYSIEGEGYPGWQELPLEQKISIIEEVIAKDIQPYVELDAGGVRVLNLIGNREVIIAYSGSCTTCYSATGATLNAIQQILRAKVCRDLIVTPDLIT